jgi:hypothetical protein
VASWESRDMSGVSGVVCKKTMRETKKEKIQEEKK